ncbi:MAG: hypothetical protein ACI9X4_000139 [Glaciecola sp.]|jgi:hypothetical protein
MEAGVILDSRLHDSGHVEYTKPACWIDAKEITFETQASAEAPGQFEIDSYRCTECGFLEMYAGGKLKE